VRSTSVGRKRRCGAEQVVSCSVTKPVLCFAPSKPGSGFDTTMRAVTATLAREKLVPVAVPVENASSGVAGTATIVLRHKNNPI